MPRLRLVIWAGQVVLGATVPRLLYFAGRLRGGSLAAYVAASWMYKFVVLLRMRPAAERHNARVDAARAHLRSELGREPTKSELRRAFGSSHP